MSRFLLLPLFFLFFSLASSFLTSGFVDDFLAIRGRLRNSQRFISSHDLQYLNLLADDVLSNHAGGLGAKFVIKRLMSLFFEEGNPAAAFLLAQRIFYYARADASFCFLSKRVQGCLLDNFRKFNIRQNSLHFGAGDNRYLLQGLLTKDHVFVSLEDMVKILQNACDDYNNLPVVAIIYQAQRDHIRPFMRLILGLPVNYNSELQVPCADIMRLVLEFVGYDPWLVDEIIEQGGDE